MNDDRYDDLVGDGRAELVRLPDGTEVLAEALGEGPSFAATLYGRRGSVHLQADGWYFRPEGDTGWGRFLAHEDWPEERVRELVGTFGGAVEGALVLTGEFASQFPPEYVDAARAYLQETGAQGFVGFSAVEPWLERNRPELADKAITIAAIATELWNAGSTTAAAEGPAHMHGAVGGALVREGDDAGREDELVERIAEQVRAGPLPLSRLARIVGVEEDDPALAEALTRGTLSGRFRIGNGWVWRLSRLGFEDYRPDADAWYGAFDAVLRRLYGVTAGVVGLEREDAAGLTGEDPEAEARRLGERYDMTELDGPRAEEAARGSGGSNYRLLDTAQEGGDSLEPAAVVEADDSEGATTLAKSLWEDDLPEGEVGRPAPEDLGSFLDEWVGMSEDYLGRFRKDPDQDQEVEGSVDGGTQLGVGAPTLDLVSRPRGPVVEGAREGVLDELERAYAADAAWDEWDQDSETRYAAGVLEAIRDMRRGAAGMPDLTGRGFDPWWDGYADAMREASGEKEAQAEPEVGGDRVARAMDLFHEALGRGEGPDSAFMGAVAGARLNPDEASVFQDQVAAMHPGLRVGRARRAEVVVSADDPEGPR